MTAEPQLATSLEREARIDAALRRRLERRGGRPQPRLQAGPVRLSHVQESLWIMSRLAGRVATNNRPIKLRLTGALNQEGLEWAVQCLLERHSILRSTFPLLEDTPVQMVGDASAVKWEVVDLSDLEPIRRMEQARRLAREHTRKWIDLGNEIPFIPLLVRLDDQDHLLAIASHHIVFDGWSEQILISELANLYDVWCEGGRVDPLPVLPIQFSDFAEFERSSIGTDKLESQLQYWQRNLAELPPDLELPCDRAIEDRMEGPVEVLLGPELSASIEDLAKEQGATLFMVLLAALNILLARHSAQDDLVIGVPTAGRRWVETEALIGCFINTVLLRTSVAGDPNFVDLLSQVRRVALEALDHQEVPYSQVLGAIRPWGSGDETPLYRVHFQLRNFPQLPVPTRHLVVEEFDPLTAGGAHLSIKAWPGRGGLRIQIGADPARFDRKTIERWAGHYRRLLEAVVAKPNAPVRQHVLIDDDEAAALLGFNRPAVSAAPATLATDSLRVRASVAPDLPAIAEGEIVLSFGDVDDLADRLAGRLAARGVNAGDRVVLYMERGIAAVVSMLGVMRAGAAFVPIDVGSTSVWLNSVITDTEPALIIASSSHVEQVRSAQSAAEVVSYDDLLAGPIGEPPRYGPRPTDLAYVLYTSGSTGRPKGVMVEQQQLATFIANSSAHRRLAPGDRILLFHTISFDACFDSIFVPLAAGATMVVRDPTALASVPRFLSWCEREQINVMDIPTSFFNVLATEMLASDLDLPATVRLITIGGEQGRASLVVRWQQRFGNRVGLANDYGPTETTVWVATKDVDPHIEAMTWLPIGKPSPGCPVYVLDGQGRLSPIGIPGELHIGGGQVARGYLKRPEITSDRFIEDPFTDQPSARMYRTGDLGRWLPDGDLEVMGRIDRQAKIRGYRVEPGEVEEGLRGLDGVADCAVLVRQDGAGEATLAAYVQMHPGAVFAREGFLSLLALRLPPFLLPASLLQVESLPRTTSGKLDAAKLPMQSTEDLGVREAEQTADPTPIEAQLIEIWTEVLGRAVDTQTGFFELGGHSLLAIRVMSRIQLRLGVEIPLSALFSHPTIELLAEVVAAHMVGAPGQLDDLLDELESMSDEEAAALLARMDEASGGQS